jgi:hypothetical protein
LKKARAFAGSQESGATHYRGRKRSAREFLVARIRWSRKPVVPATGIAHRDEIVARHATGTMRPSCDHPDNWRWGAGERFRWREHEGRGYWLGGRWTEFD